MNFGAMNKDGSEKRLNVAVTRARREIHVFAALRATDIDIARTRYQGVKDLRDFLDYAGRGAAALAEADTGSMGDVDSPFEADVMAALERRGWEVRTQIGVSGYRVDLGIVHPDRAGAYLAGVECDAASYHSSPSARDRDRMRETILRGLGWEIERVWSTDWFMRREDALERLDAALRALLERSREKGQLEAERAEEKRVETARAEAARVEAEHEMPEPPPAALAEEALSEPVAILASPLMAATLAHTRDAAPGLPLDNDLHGLRSASVPTAKPDPDRFFDENYKRTLVEMIDAIVAAQGPIHLDAVARKITQAHGWARVGKNIRARVEDCATGPDRTRETGGTILWPNRPESIVPFRDVEGRDPAEIPTAEIAGLLRTEPRLRHAEDPAL